jgi:hypothetical protein
MLLFADAVCTHEDRGFVAVFPKRRCPFDSGQNTTIGCKPVRLEMYIDQHMAPLAEVLYRVGLDIGMCVLQVIEVSLLIRTPLLFQDLDVLVGFALVWTEQEQIGLGAFGDSDVP